MDLQRNASVHRKQLRGEPPRVGDDVTAFRSLVGAEQKRAFLGLRLRNRGGGPRALQHTGVGQANFRMKPQLVDLTGPL